MRQKWIASTFSLPSFPQFGRLKLSLFNLFSRSSRSGSPSSSTNGGSRLERLKIGARLHGLGLQRFGAFILGGLRKVASITLSVFLGTGSKTIEDDLGSLTAFQRWKRMYRPLTPLGIQLRRSRKLLTPSRPYLLEVIAGSGFDVGGFIAFLIFLAVIGIYLRMLWPTIQNAAGLIGLGHGSSTFSKTAAASAPSGARSNPLVDGISSGPTATATPEFVTATMAPTITPYPTATGLPATVTPTPAYQSVHVLYSYYNPDLGGVNCHSANWDGSKCADTTASGIKWSEYMGRGVAIAPSWYNAGLGYGSILRVVAPDAIAGDYTVIDLCSGCEANNWPDRQYRLDFLDDRQRLTWAYPVDLLIINVVQPAEVP